MKRTIIFAVIYALIALGAVAPVMAQEPDEISVYVNGTKVEFGENKPVIRNSRTLAPARAVFGSIGAEIGWDALNKAVTVELDGKTVKLWIGNRQATYSTSEASKYIMSDVPPQIVNEVTYVPLSFIAESLGGEVSWNNAERAAYFTFDSMDTPKAPENAEKPENPEKTEDDAATELAEAPGIPEAYEGENQNLTPSLEYIGAYEIPGIKLEMAISGLKASIGDQTEKTDTNFGKNNSRSESVYGYAWQEVNIGRDSYALVGGNMGTVTAFYSNSQKVTIAGIRSGMSGERLNRELGAELPRARKTVIATDDGLLTVYRNSMDDYSVIAVMAQKTGFTKPLSKITSTLFTESTERQLAGIINTERLNRGLEPIKIDAELSSSARGHSEAMAAGNYLSGADSKGDTPLDRITGSIEGSFAMASENIGRGVVDAIEIYCEWMNNVPDFANITFEHYDSFGVGVSPCPNNHKMYFTADFVQK